MSAANARRLIPVDRSALIDYAHVERWIRLVQQRGLLRPHTQSAAATAFVALDAARQRPQLMLRHSDSNGRQVGAGVRVDELTLLHLRVIFDSAAAWMCGRSPALLRHYLREQAALVNLALLSLDLVPCNAT